MISPKKAEILFSPTKIVSFFQKKSKDINFPFKKVKIELIKKFKSEKSFKIVAVYLINKKIKIVGCASSGGEREYAFKINNLIFKKYKNLAPKPYCYIKPLGLFLMENLLGKNFGEILKEHKVKKNHLKMIAKSLALLQKVNNFKKIKKKGIDFSSIQKTIKFLKKEKKLKIFFKTLKKRLKNEERKNKNLIFVHGDFNPYNFIFRRNKLKIIDFEDAHFGDRVEDPANFISHLENSFDFDIPRKKRILFVKNFLNYYQQFTKRFNKEEKERFELYKTYFNFSMILYLMGFEDKYSKSKEMLKNLLKQSQKF